MNAKKNILSLLFLFMFAVISACSTVEVHIMSDITPAPYSGTSFAFNKTKQQWYKYDFYGLIVLTAFDIPFSFLADTVLYPIDIYRLNNQSETNK